jgi:prophage regulatory protein
MEERILRRKELERRLSLSRSTIYSLMARGRLPRPIRLTDGRAVGWRESEINAWLDTRERTERFPSQQVAAKAETGLAAAPTATNRPCRKTGRCR